MSKKYNFYRVQYKLRRISAERVWQAVDDEEITATEAAMICGPRPAVDGEEGKA